MGKYGKEVEAEAEANGRIGERATESPRAGGQDDGMEGWRTVISR